MLTVLALVGPLFASPVAMSAQRPRPDSTEPQRTTISTRDKIGSYRRRLIGVYDEASGQPLDSVRVTDILTGASILTSRTGAAVLLFAAGDGGSLVRLQKIGYEMKKLPLSSELADSTEMTVFLRRITTLPRVVVRDSAEPYLSPMLRDFERRKNAGFGHFIGEAELRKNDNTTMANLLTTHIPGLTRSSRGAGAYLVSSREMCAGPALSKCTTPNCYPNVYLDGTRYTEAGSLPNAVDFSKWSPTEFAAVEFYSSLEVPEEFGGSGAKCGVLLLWTRER